MAWRLATYGDLPALIDFLKIEEWKNVGFTSCIRKNRFLPQLKEEKKSLFLKIKNIFNNNINDFKNYIILLYEKRKEQYIYEAILLTPYGLIIPVLSSHNQLHQQFNIHFRSILKRYRTKLHSIIGSSKSVTIMEKFFPVKPTSILEYHLMTIDKLSLKSMDTPFSNDLIVRKASIKDAPYLFELQKSYELEEVFIDPKHFNPKNCYHLLKRTLQNETVFLAEINNMAVAKAGTNAQGYTVDQIGGVYTHLDYRRNNIGYMVLKELLVNIFEKGKSACLFVKKNNKAAISLYRKIGFSIKGDFKITYYYK